MKHQRPLFVLFAAIAACCWSVSAFACDQEKGTKATAASNTKGASAVTATCPASSMCTGAKGASAVTASATQCTPEMMAACSAAKKAGANISCPMDGKHGTKGVATTASMEGCCAKGGASATTATTAATMGGAAGAGKTSMTGGSCAMHGTKATAVTAGATHGCSGAEGAMAAGSSCAAHGATASARHAGCTFCQELNSCDQEMRTLGAVAQVVSLKNGVMFVYTSDPAKVRAVQSAMARRKDQTAIFASTDGGDHLCNDCKAMRGAAASGKLTREVVNIDTGCLTLMTSSDPAVVARIHELAGVPTTRIKS